LLEKLQDDKDVPSFTAYEKLEIDLGEARTDMEFEHRGDFLMVERLDGDLSVRLHHKEAPSIDLGAIRRFTHTPFTKIFLTNTGQSNKTAILLIGKTDMFQPERRERQYHEAADSTLFEDEDLPAGGLITHYNIITSGYDQLYIMVESNASVTIYPQVSHNGVDWYNHHSAGDAARSYSIDNEKHGKRQENIQPKYFRILIYANAAATVSAYITLQS